MKIDRHFLKYNNIIEITPDLYKILNHKVKTYEKPGNLVKLTLGNFTIIKNLISNVDINFYILKLYLIVFAK